MACQSHPTGSSNSSPGKVTPPSGKVIEPPGTSSASRGTASSREEIYCRQVELLGRWDRCRARRADFVHLDGRAQEVQLGPRPEARWQPALGYTVEPDGRSRRRRSG